jgi:aryl carrier-like protein
MMMTDENVNETTPLIDIGVDSLVAVDIRTWFAQQVGADVAVLKILGGPSIEELVDDVVSKLDLTTDSGEVQSVGGSITSFESREDTSSSSSPVTGESSSSDVRVL